MSEDINKYEDCEKEITAICEKYGVNCGALIYDSEEKFGRSIIIKDKKNTEKGYIDIMFSTFFSMVERIFDSYGEYMYEAMSTMVLSLSDIFQKRAHKDEEINESD